LREGLDGLLAPDNDDAAIAAHVLKLLGEPAYARQLAATAHATLSAYEWPVVREGWLRAYRQVAGDHREVVGTRPVPSAPSNSA
jgi:hypothetical protein